MRSCLFLFAAFLCSCSSDKVEYSSGLAPNSDTRPSEEQYDSSGAANAAADLLPSASTPSQILENELEAVQAEDVQLVGQNLVLLDAGRSELIGLRLSDRSLHRLLEQEVTAFTALPTTDRLLTIDADGSGTLLALGSGKTLRLPLRPGHKTLSPSPNGRHALVSIAPDQSGPTSGGAYGLGEVTLVNVASTLAASTAQSFALTSPPEEVRFSADGTRLYVRSTRGIEIIDLTAPGGSTPIAFRPTPKLAASVSRLLLDPEHGRAFCIDGSSALLVIQDLDDGTERRLPLPAVPTDLDLLPGSAGALLVARDGGVLMRWTDATDDVLAHRTGTAIGAAHVLEGSTTIVLSTSVDPDGAIRLVDLARLSAANFDPSTDLTRVELARPVEAVTLAPGGSTIVLYHPTSVGSEDPYPGSELVTLVATETGQTVPLLLPERPRGLAFSTDGAYAYLALGTASVLIEVSLTDLVARSLPLPEAPLLVGALPETQGAFTLLHHPLGKLAFLARGAEPTFLTGFALNFSGEDQ